MGCIISPLYGQLFFSELPTNYFFSAHFVKKQHVKSVMIKYSSFYQGVEMQSLEKREYFEFDSMGLVLKYRFYISDSDFDETRYEYADLGRIKKETVVMKRPSSNYPLERLNSWYVVYAYELNKLSSKKLYLTGKDTANLQMRQPMLESDVQFIYNQYNELILEIDSLGDQITYYAHENGLIYKGYSHFFKDIHLQTNLKVDSVLEAEKKQGYYAVFMNERLLEDHLGKDVESYSYARDGRITRVRQKSGEGKMEYFYTINYHGKLPDKVIGNFILEKEKEIYNFEYTYF